MARGVFGVCGFLAFIAVLLAASGAKAASKSPPPFQENLGARVNEIPRADNDPNYRLPNNTEPVQYHVKLTTKVHLGDYDFNGKVTIQLRVLEDTRTIVLHARQLNSFAATIRRENAQNSYPLGTQYEELREFLSLTPNDGSLTFIKGEVWILTIEYKGLLRKDNGGFYMSTYTDADNKTRYLATTQFESTNARHGYPCYDEPARRANFTISINHDPSYRAISNMPVNTTVSTSGYTVFQTTVRMSTYLTAFIVSDLNLTEGELHHLPQRVFSRPGTEHDQEWALVSGMLIEERLADYYGVDFALPKLDQVAVPDFAAGAMENWGLVTYREEYLLYNKHTSTVNTQTSIAVTIAHEYAHQWFGNYVAVKWWTYLWLKEGFANFYSYQATDDAYPEWGIYQLFHTDEYQSALNNDAGNTPRPMTHYVQTPRDISQLYDTISYKKAGSVLSMFQNALTKPVFRRGLHNYLTNNQYSAGEELDLFNAIQTAAKEENFPIPATVEVMMSSWTRQGGYPLLHVERNYNDGSFTIRQQPFFNDASHSANHTWFIPTNAATQSNPDFRDTKATHFLANQKEVQVKDVQVAKDDWLILNKQSTGYYRINYDEKNWGLITQGLMKKPYKIHPRNRAQLLHDAYRLSATDKLKHNILMDLMGYLPSEDQYAPWSTVNSILTVFNRFLSGDTEYTLFKNYVTELVTNIYDKLGVNDVSGEQHLQKYTRSLVIKLACMVDIPSCLQETNNKLIDLIENGIEIEPNLQTQIYCNGLRQSKDREFNFVFDMLMNSDDQAKRRILISSLGCSQNENHLKKFVESSIDKTNKLRTQERTTLLNPAYSRGEVGLYVSINFLKQHSDEYGSMTAGSFVGNNPLDSDIRGMSLYVVNKDQEKALLELVELVKDSKHVTATLEKAVKANIQDNYDWLAKNRDPVIGWLVKYYQKPMDGSSAGIHASAIGVALVLLLTRLF